MPSPLVSVISVIYNQVEVTCAMLASLRQVTYPNLEILVVDNASQEDTGVISQKFPEVIFIRSEQNLGFAGGNNLAIRKAKGQYLLFLNNDTEVEPAFLEPLVYFLQAHPEAGIVSPKIIYHGTDQLIQFAGHTGLNPLTGRGWTIGYLEKDNGQHNHITETALVHGAAMMVPMAVIEKTGLMPELYFLYYEEHDWCEMIKRAGYRSYYVGTSTVYHKESVSVGKASVLKTYYLNRNRLLFIRRNNHGLQFWLGLLFFLLVAVPKNMLTFILQFQLKHVRALFRGLWWNLRKRQANQNNYLTPSYLE